MGKKRVVSKTKDELLKERAKVESSVKKDVQLKTSRKIREGRVYISSSYNNTLLTLTDTEGKALFWTSAGRIGFKGTKKGTPFAASKVAMAMIQAITKLKIEKIKIFVKGIGSGRASAMRSLAVHGLEILSIKDVTPIPHNGCRAKKPRRM